MPAGIIQLEPARSSLNGKLDVPASFAPPFDLVHRRFPANVEFLR